jgi:hypothetical protein
VSHNGTQTQLWNNAGDVTLLGKIGAGDGAVGAPGLTFASDLDNGLYRIGTNTWGMAAAGAAVWITTAAGEITTPLNPAVLAYISGGDDNNVTGDSTDYTIKLNSEAYDRNSDWNAGSYTWTAPVTGIYSFFCSVIWAGIVSNHARCDLQSTASNRTMIMSSMTLYNVIHSTDAGGQAGSGQVDMDAADTLYFMGDILGGSKVVDNAWAQGGVALIA